MAKVGVITFLHNDNYGSSLQAYALQRTIRDMGHDCEHLDYLPDSREKIRNMLHSGNDMKLILDGIRKRSVKAGQQGARVKSSAIPAFYEKCMQLSSVCHNQAELQAAAEKYDVLVCGSDQIWNPVWLNPAYFLTFAPEGKRKIAYAASLGISRLPAEAKIQKIRKWTEGFDAVSVREKEGAALLKKMTGLEAEVMPDPVCLLSREEWAEAAASAPEGEPYLLCYFIGENDAYWDQVRHLELQTGLRVLVMPVTAGSYQSGFQLLDGAGPEEFLGAVKNAAMLCTDSFHGLAFGTIFGVKTELIRRYREDDPESKNSRVDHFRRLTAEKGMDEIRREGREWLEKAIGGDSSSACDLLPESADSDRSSSLRSE
ncbi:MAG: polysaccharide pyruvyl transferase family protein [Clostridia bacterium]|nr:polysaccharide pyruvyl transferase family protein [Clostridia bacterium]